MSSLTQPLILSPSIEQSLHQFGEIERLEQEFKEATEIANQAFERCTLLVERMKFVQQQLAMFFE